MSTFTAAQLAYLTERRLARIATVGADGTPHVTPVGMWSHNPEHESIDVTGRNLAQSKKFRDVASTARAAIVIDDLARPLATARHRNPRSRRDHHRTPCVDPYPPRSGHRLGPRRITRPARGSVYRTS
jgi:PPOX class F420-dependent enzyme/OxyR family protein